LRTEAPVRTPASASASAPGSHGARSASISTVRPDPARHLERVAEQAEAGDVGHRVDAAELAQLRAHRVQLRGRGDERIVAGASSFSCLSAAL
jgi:hypothetical protein